MTKLILATLFCCLSTLFTDAQTNLPQVEMVSSGTKTSLRGLSVVNDRVVWVSGSKGTIGKSTDGGKTWKWVQVKGFEDRDFRDIEAFDASTALIMAVSSPAYILKTINGGDTWKAVYVNSDSAMFLDAMDFWNEDAGIVIGDPINGKIFIARTFDGGDSWKEVTQAFKPTAEKGEALFAASGTNIRPLDRDEAVFVTGGTVSKIYIRDGATKLPLLQGKETTGANSIAVIKNKKKNGGSNLMVVGGDFNNPESDSLNCFYSTNHGKTWKAPKTPPHGYRSCVEYLSKNQAITCGITGVDYTFDGGNTWKLISKEGFNTCRIAKNGSAIFLAGSNGRIAKIIVPQKKTKSKL